ncbi:MAG: ABC-F family ATP-binding cassette domain-containing protein, partial [Pseudomonadota bacterium]|nr:ABC-F family ATP-binding cassette domain-containing protein [Pseudomonadota bacterium]
MLEIRDMSYSIAGEPLFKRVSLQVFEGQRLGLVGCNGCGKSTFFRLLLGQLDVDSGQIDFQSGKAMAYVEQELSKVERSVLDFVIDGDVQLREIERVLASRKHDEMWFEAQNYYEAIDGYSARSRAARLLHGLGFSSAQMTGLVSDLSGGWRMRVNLARALMKRADLLLLDEPTNHLDMEAIIWLESYLLSYPGSMIIVSHDRIFLNACVDKIAHIQNYAIDLYTGNYDDFERTHAERLSQHKHALQIQQSKVAHLEDFVRRFRAKATKAKQAQSRLKALERLTRLAPIYSHVQHFELRIEAPESSPQVLMCCTDLAFGYEGQPLLFKRTNFRLLQGDRIGLLGQNGAGKTSFIKLLTGDLFPQQGQIEVNPSVRIGYFSQHQLEALDGFATPLEHLQKLAPDEPVLVLRTFLGTFGLGGDRENRVVAHFSGGEKSRLALALLAWQRPHVLLLDEPTNHLDLDMRDALALALEEYAGAVVLISHDRALMKMVPDELWVVSDQSVRLFEGDLDDYADWVKVKMASSSEGSLKPGMTRPVLKLRKKA